MIAIITDEAWSNRMAWRDGRPSRLSQDELLSLNARKEYRGGLVTMPLFKDGRPTGINAAGVVNRRGGIRWTTDDGGRYLPFDDHQCHKLAIESRRVLTGQAEQVELFGLILKLKTQL